MPKCIAKCTNDINDCNERNRINRLYDLNTLKRATTLLVSNFQASESFVRDNLKFTNSQEQVPIPNRVLTLSSVT